MTAYHLLSWNIIMREIFVLDLFYTYGLYYI